MNQTRLPIFLLALAAPLALLTTSFALARDGDRLAVGPILLDPQGRSIDLEPSAVNKPGILLTKTVGTNPSRCATTDALTVPAGAQVTYCYRVLNTGDVTFDSHDLSDDQLGKLFSGVPLSLAPGASVMVTAATTINKPTVNIGSWTARNTSTRDSATATDTATVTLVKPATFPVCEGFEGGALPSSFYAETTAFGSSVGRVEVTSANPHSGNHALDLDTECSACSATTSQAAVMEVDLAGQNSAYLSFWVREHGDENNPEDGVFISDDGGATWFQIQSLNGFPTSYQYVGIDLVAAANNAGMSLVDGFRIKFQSRDNFDIPSDGYSFDDICVQPHEIALSKTVGTDPGACATSDILEISAPTEVTYCYRATNLGDLPVSLHSLQDSELGSIFSGLAYSLAPGASVMVTQTETITATTTNTATWTSYNPGDVDQMSATDSATVRLVTPAAFPVCEGFEDGTLPPSFYAETTSAGFANGRVAVTTAFPHSGTYGLDIDTDCAACGGETAQAAVMVVDLAGQSTANLSFWIFEHIDENDPEDGVFISDDNGISWAQILSLNGFPSSYQYVSLDLGEAASNVGMSLVDGFRVKFQSRDNTSITAGDGYSFDDICINSQLYLPVVLRP